MNIIHIPIPQEASHFHYYIIMLQSLKNNTTVIQQEGSQTLQLTFRDFMTRTIAASVLQNRRSMGHRIEN